LEKKASITSGQSNRHASHASFPSSSISLDRLLADLLLEHNRANPFNPVFDPSSEIIGIIQWYHLYRKWYQPKDEVDTKKITNLGDHIVHVLHVLHILYRYAYYAYFTYCVPFWYPEQCRTVFPYTNGHGHPVMATGKNHSILHTLEMLHTVVMLLVCQ
jgi:hypothetical protein